MAKSSSLEDKGLAGAAVSNPKLNLGGNTILLLPDSKKAEVNILIDHWSNYHGKWCFTAIFILSKTLSDRGRVTEGYTMWKKSV